MTRRRAFTLIELLVVVTVIVVLIALLAPALDQAVYQAELTLCGANQRAFASSTVTYALDDRRRIPGSELPRNDTGEVATEASYEPQRLRRHNENPTEAYDRRPFWDHYIDINQMFNDPVTGTVELEDEGLRSGVMGSRMIWAGWSYPNEKRMRRIGDRFTWDSNAFSVLIGDLLTNYINGDTVQSSHPDPEGSLWLIVHENFDNNVRVQTYARYHRAGRIGNNNPLAPLSMNYGYMDNSVRRFNDVTLNDERFKIVPILNTDTSTGSNQTILPHE